MLQEIEIPTPKLACCSICLLDLKPSKQKPLQYAHPKCTKIHLKYEKALENLAECQYDLVMLSKH